MQNSDYASDSVLRQGLNIEEYGAIFIYIKSVNNVVADALSHRPTNQSYKEEGALQEELFLDRIDFEDQVAFPLDLARITDLQQDDEQLIRM